jgi:hypothetical protein
MLGLLTVLTTKSTKASAISATDVSPTKSRLGVSVSVVRVVVAAVIRIVHEERNGLCQLSARKHHLIILLVAHI